MCNVILAFGLDLPSLRWCTSLICRSPCFTPCSTCVRSQHWCCGPTVIGACLEVGWVLWLEVSRVHTER